MGTVEHLSDSFHSEPRRQPNPLELSVGNAVASSESTQTLFTNAMHPKRKGKSVSSHCSSKSTRSGRSSIYSHHRFSLGYVCLSMTSCVFVVMCNFLCVCMFWSQYL